MKIKWSFQQIDEWGYLFNTIKFRANLIDAALNLAANLQIWQGKFLNITLKHMVILSWV